EHCADSDRRRAENQTEHARPENLVNQAGGAREDEANANPHGQGGGFFFSRGSEVRQFTGRSRGSCARCLRVWIRERRQSAESRNRVRLSRASRSFSWSCR